MLVQRAGLLQDTPIWDNNSKSEPEGGPTNQRPLETFADRDHSI